ncbi:MAG TPA: ATP-dependent DNA helicase [Burkholderiaceae bacterium]|jgi:ATP-dependent DNA helicase DinG|nr:ATP-dependent DNA helicase [Burkholderiaceae bacterium]
MAAPRVDPDSDAFAKASAPRDALGKAAAPGDDVLARRQQVADAFAPDGALARSVPGFVARPSQQDMALAVFDAIVERGTLVAEAGTGTGKTFAYLVPSLLAGGKVLVSVGTKTLQDQIFDKDLRIVGRALGMHTDAVLLKGRQNYICLHRLNRALGDGLHDTREAAAHLHQIERFARASSSGDRAELSTVPETAAIWHAVTSTQDNCLGAECPQFEPCFVYRARRRALAAQTVVVNHHLFLADMALRDDRFGELLPAADTVVLDEAHHLPRIGTEFFGEGWSLAQVAELASDALASGLHAARDGAPWVDLTRSLDQAARAIRASLAQAGLEAGARIALERLADRAPLGAALEALSQRAEQLNAALERNSGRDPELDLLTPRLQRLRALLQDWRQASAAATQAEADPGVVRWISTTSAGAQFHATPLSISASFARARERGSQAWILTSATLTVASRFDAFLGEIGLRATTRRWDSPFDFPSQALLYLPDPLPSPASERFAEEVADAAWPVIRASRGRAFVLCATLRAVERVAARLLERMHESGLELPLLVQGQGTRRNLLQTYRATTGAVLVGSISFWEGIDVRGDALSLVVIDKLPFAPPDDPLVQARVRKLRSEGRNAFVEFQLPQAVTLLKQGVGRLIRDERDRGVLMILDGRLLSRSYGKIVLDSLPPFALTRDQSVACAFFRDS